ncbi:hypothetical protein [Collimonas silvisoli]|uniref:hypothetical protein n=1 Tax=Collimonas silvisoli TaxID=2825884 RepID=UPI001B8C979E|nr:hypothetical protein [Collimonas silvisoli]
MENLKISHALKLLAELQNIYCKEGGENFVSGIMATMASLSDDQISEKDRWSQACSVYRTMAGSKSGFMDFYIDRESAEQRIIANARLDNIRDELWALFDY